MQTDLHFSSATNEWSTPQDFYSKLDAEFGFTLDPCATAENAKCAKFFTEADDGLAQDWTKDIVFMNPPYGRGIKHWIKKAHDEARKGATVVCLIPARTDTTYWHEYVIGGGAEVRFIKGRLKFGGHTNSAPFPSAIAVFDYDKLHEALSSNNGLELADGTAAQPTPKPAEGELTKILWEFRSHSTVYSIEPYLEHIEALMADQLAAQAKAYDEKFEAVMKEAEAAEVDPRKVWYGSKDK